MHFLIVLYPPPSFPSPRALSSPPQPRKQREKLIALTQEAWEEPTPPSPLAAAQNPTSAPPPLTNTQKKRAFPDTCKEWDEDADTEENVAKDVTIQQKMPQPSVMPPQPSPRPTTQQATSPRPQKRKQAEGPTPPAPKAQAQQNRLGYHHGQRIPRRPGLVSIG